VSDQGYSRGNLKIGSECKAVVCSETAFLAGEKSVTIGPDRSDHNCDLNRRDNVSLRAASLKTTLDFLRSASHSKM
jgi:hypothetical protein